MLLCNANCSYKLAPLLKQPAKGTCLLQGCTECGGPEADNTFNHGTGSRLFKFWVTDRRGDKLDYPRCTALIYTMGLLLGRSNAPLRPPGSSLATITDTGGSSVL